MIRFGREKVLYLHRLLTKATGEDPNLLDAELLDGALESAFLTRGGKELYPTIQEKAARIGHFLITNPAFAGANKGIGMVVLLAFSEVNGVRISPTKGEVARVGSEVADGKMTYEDLLQWILVNQ